MSVYSYIEVYQPGEENKRGNPHLGFGHGIGWFYQIAVAGGKRTYTGAEYSGDLTLQQLEETTAMSIYELPIAQALDNYQAVIQALYSLVELNVKYCANEQFYHELGLVAVTKHWFERVQQKMPNGIVKLDWCEAVWGATQEQVAKSDGPNHNFKLFVNLSHDCNNVLNKKLSPEEFEKKYPQYGKFEVQDPYIEEEPF